MKTVQEWLQEEDSDDSLMFPKLLRRVQADAYRAGMLRAAELCRQLIKLGYVSAGKAAKAIEAEAQKGQP